MKCDLFPLNNKSPLILVMLKVLCRNTSNDMLRVATKTWKPSITNWPVVREPTGDRRILLTKGKVRRKAFPCHDILMICFHGPLARYIKLWVAYAPGMPGTFFSPPRVRDPDMHHGTCVTKGPWCMPGSLTSGFLWSRWCRKTFLAFPAHAQPAILLIW